LNLPPFNVPRLPPKNIPADVYEQWLLSNIRSLDDAGLLEKALRGRSRRPANVRFRLVKQSGA
jgi:hypothetical protein